MPLFLALPRAARFLTITLSLLVLCASDASAAQRVFVANRDSNSVSVLDTATNAVVGTITGVATPYAGLVVSPDGQYAYATSRFSNLVSVIDLAAGQVTGTIGVGSAPHGICLNAAGTRAYVGNALGGSVTVIDTTTNSVLTTINGVGSHPFGLTLSADQTRLYVAQFNSAGVAVIDTVSNTVLRSIPVGANPAILALSPGGAELWVVNVGGDSVSAIDTSTDTVVDTIPVGARPFGIAFSPDGATAYTGNVTGKSVTVIDTAAREVTGTIPVGKSVDLLVVTEDGSTAYATLENDQQVAVLDLEAGTLVTTVGVGVLPVAIAISPPSQAAALASVEVTPSTIVGSRSAAGTVSLVNPAPSGGATVTLASTNPAATVPASVTIPAGELSAPFTVTTAAVTTPRAGAIDATLSGVTLSAAVTVRPIGVAGLALTPTILLGGKKAEGRVTLEAPAAPGGIAVTLTSSHPTLASPVVTRLVVPAGEMSATFTIDTAAVTEIRRVTLTAEASGTSTSAVLTLKPNGIRAVGLTPNPVVGCQPVVGTVVLDVPAPAGGVRVRLHSSRPAIASVPAYVTVRQGARSAVFRVTTSPVASPVAVVIKATANGFSQSERLKVKPITVRSVSATPAAVFGGEVATGLVVLTCPAAPGDLTVTLSSSDPAVASVRGSIVVPAGSDVKTFKIRTAAVEQLTHVTISAAVNGETKTFLLTIDP
jgi:YVTN family beta-propeller protein